MWRWSRSRRLHGNSVHRGPRSTGWRGLRSSRSTAEPVTAASTWISRPPGRRWASRQSSHGRALHRQGPARGARPSTPRPSRLPKCGRGTPRPYETHDPVVHAVREKGDLSRSRYEDPSRAIRLIIANDGQNGCFQQLAPLLRRSSAAEDEWPRDSVGEIKGGEQDAVEVLWLGIAVQPA
jgi:hypothetical protein